MAILDDVLVMWEADSQVDDNHLDKSSIATAKLHAKYLRFLVEAKLKLVKLTADYNNLRKLKFRYYRGELSRQELVDLGWDQWQFNKPLKTEMDEFLKGDEDLQQIQSRVDYIQTTIFALESILGQIKQRDWQIRNSIQWKSFIAGN